MILSIALMSGVLCAASPATPVKGIIAVQPVIVLGGSEMQDAKLDSIFKMELGTYGITYADPEVVRKFLDAEPSHSCDLDYKCLGRLAKAAGASASLVVSVAPYRHETVVAASLVATNGVPLISTNNKTENPLSPNLVSVVKLRAAIRSALDGVAIRTFVAPAALPTPPPETVKHSPTPALVQTPNNPSTQPKSTQVAVPNPPPPAATVKPVPTGAWAAFGAGAACLVAGGITAVLATADANTLRARSDGHGRIAAGDVVGGRLSQQIDRESVASNILFLGGAAGVVVGGAVWFFVPTGPVQVTAAPNAHGAQVLFSGSF